MSRTHRATIPYSACIIFIFCLAFTTPAAAGPLRTLTNGGAGDVAGPGGITFSESNFDYLRPCSLFDSASNRLYVAAEHESVFRQSRGDKLLNLVVSKKKKTGFIYHTEFPSGHALAVGSETYYSDTKIITDDKLADTELYASGRGSANTVAYRAGPLTFGYFKAVTRNSLEGYSQEIIDRIEILDTNAGITGYADGKKEGYQVGYSFSQSTQATYSRINDDYKFRISVDDPDDNIVLPGNISGERRELRFVSKWSRIYSFDVSFNHASYDSLDSITYNNAAELGRWLSRAEYEIRSLFVTKTSSPNKAATFGFEDYNGYYALAGTVDLLGNTANLLSGFYLYHSHGTLNRRTYSYATKWKKGNYGYRFTYAYSRGDATFHYDSQRAGLAVLLGFMPANAVVQDRLYNYTEHRLGLGVDKMISKNYLLEYSLVQVVPILKDRAAAPVAGTGPDVERKKTRGGTMHLFTITHIF